MRPLLVLVAALLALSSLAGPAGAITNGIADDAAHPEVGALLANLPGEGLTALCSGTLVAPRVFLTAGHCAADVGDGGRVLIDFATSLDDKSSLHAGTIRVAPGYGLDKHDLHDLAVVVLDDQVAGIAPARLAPAGVADGLARVTAVGYGYHDRVTGGGRPQFLFDGLRRFATVTVSGTASSTLRLLNGPGGGVCFGDSGGPEYLAGTTTIVSVTSTGNGACTGTADGYLVDTPAARSFLAGYVPLS